MLRYAFFLLALAGPKLRAATPSLLAVAFCVGVVSSVCGQTNVTFTVSDDYDDADEASGTMYVTDGSSFFNGHVGFRFRNVTIPAGATITSATLETFSNGSGTTSFSVDIMVQDADNPPAFSTSSNNITNRPRTSAKTLWSPGSATYSVGSSVLSPNFSSSIQEVIDRPGWSSGNALVVLTTPNSGNKGIFKHSGAPTYAPQLHVTYITSPVDAGNVLLVTAGVSPTSEESARQTEFEGWGYTVSTIEDGSSQAVYDTALAANDVVYVSPAADAASLAYKLRKAKIGVVHEGISSWDDNVGWTTSTGQQANTCTTMTVVDNTHPISEHFSTGTVTIFNSSTGSNGSQVAATVAGGAEVLANNRCINAGSPNLLVMEIGSALANTHDGNSTASGRRVRLPFGGFGVSSWSNVSADGLTMVRSALEWASSDGLLLHWKLDDATGATATDSSGNGNDGTLTGSQGWTAGKDGGAHTFDSTDGTDDYFEAPTNSDLDDVHEDNFTVMAYCKPNSVPPGTGSANDAQYAILIKEGNHVGLNYSNDKKFQFDCLLDGDVWSGTGTWSTTYEPGQWYHVAGVFDRDAGEVKIYIDGVLVNTDTFTPGTAGADRGSARWRVGIASPGSSSWRWAADADIDDARIYNRALSDEEISQFVNFGLVGHWKLDETSGTVAADSGPNGADGTYENGTALDQGGPYPGVTAAAFDGSNDHVELPTLNANFQSGLTIAAWVQPDATLGSGEFHEILDLSNGSEVDQILLSYNGAAGLQLFLTDTTDGSSIRTIEDNKGFTAGRWVHCVATIDADGNATLYRNGEVTKSGFFTSLPASISRSTATIGKSAFGDHFGGGLYDVRLYNHELSAAEIHELYGLVGQWDFDEGTGTTIAESSGVASDASFNTGTPMWVDGVRGKAIEFDGTNDARTDETIEPPPVGAVSLWMRSDGPPTTRQRPWGIGSDYEMWQDPDGLVSMDLSTDGYQGGFITTEPLYDEGRWRHILAQYNSDDDSYEIYLDGVLHKSGVSTKDIKQQAANHLTFGTRTGNTAERYTGVIDDFRIYNRWLNSAEIAELYGLVGHWRMEETSGSVVSDSSGAGNHGAIVGTADWSSDAKEASGSLELDGTNYVEIPGVPVDGDSVSIAGWAKLGSADSAGAELLSLGNYLAIRLDDGYYGTSAFAYTGAGFDFTGVGYDHASAGWRHFAAVFDDDDMELRLYVDGVLRSAEPASGAVILSGWGTNTRMGEHASGETTRSFTGLMDDMRVYNRAISPAEVRTLYYGEYVPGLRIVKWVEVANP